MTKGRSVNALPDGSDRVGLGTTVGEYLVVGTNTGVINIFAEDGLLHSSIPLAEEEYYAQIVPLSPTQMAIAYRNQKIKIYDLTTKTFTHELTAPADFTLYRMTVAGDKLMLLGDNAADDAHSVLLSYDISDRENLKFNAPESHQVPLHHTYSSYGSTAETFDTSKQIEIFGVDGYALYKAPDQKGFYVFDTDHNTCTLLKMPAKVVAADIWEDGRILMVVDYSSDKEASLTKSTSEVFVYDCRTQELELVATLNSLPLNITALSDGEHYIYENNGYFIKSVVDPDVLIGTNIQTYGRIHHLLATDSGRLIHLNLENFATVDLPEYKHKVSNIKSQIAEEKQSLMKELDEHIIPDLIPGIVDQVNFSEQIRESKTINVISQQNVTELFKKIYEGLLAGESRFFKNDFLKDKKNLSASKLIESIKANSSDPEVKKAWELANKYLDKPVSDKRLFSEMYLYAFEHSRLFSRAVVDNQTFYSSKSLKSYLYKNYGGVVPEKDITVDSESRTAKIKAAIRRSY